MSDSNPTLSMAVLQVLKDSGMTLSQVAHVLELQPSEISRVHHGEREFKASHLLLIAQHLGLPLAGLLAKAMVPFTDHEEAGNRLAALLHEVATEVDVILKLKSRPEDKRPVLLKRRTAG